MFCASSAKVPLFLFAVRFLNVSEQGINNHYTEKQGCKQEIIRIHMRRWYLKGVTTRRTYFNASFFTRSVFASSLIDSERLILL